MTVAVREPVQVISSNLEDLRAGLSGLDDDEIVHARRQIEEVSGKAHSIMLDVVAEADMRRIAARNGFGTTPRMLSAMLRVSAAEARTRTEHAALVGPRRAMTGQPMAPRLPVTAAALAAGQIGAGQLKVITETMTMMPASVTEPAPERVEADLACYADEFDPRRLRLIAHRMLDILDPDGPRPSDDSIAATSASGELWLRERRDGRLGLEGWLNPEHGSMGIRRALVARDGGCSFPGCDRPPGLCAAHHTTHWVDGGETSVNNCCLVCAAHHQQLYLQGWDVTIRDGRVEFRPPAIIDPNRRPLTNPLRR